MLYCNVSVKILDTIPGSQYIKLITKQNISESAVSDIIDMVQKIILKSRHNLVACGSEDLVEGSLVLLNIPVFEGVNSIWTRGQIIGRSELVDHVRVLLCDFGSINYEVPVYQLFKFVHAIPTLQTQFELCYLADATPLGPAGYSKSCMEYLNNLILNKEVKGTAWREKGKVTLLRPFSQPQGRLITEILAENNLIRLVQFFPHGRPGSYPGKNVPVKAGVVPGLPKVPPKPKMKSQTKFSGGSEETMSEKKSSEIKLSDTCSNETGNSEEDQISSFASFFAYQSLPLEGKHSCLVTLVENGPWSFSAILNSYAKEIECLLENVEERPVPDIKVATPVLLKKDEKLYRAAVASESPELKVWLVDIGAYEVVKRNELFVAPQSLIDIPARFVQCKLQGLPRTVNQAITHSFEKTVEDREFEMVVGKAMPNGVHKVYLELNGHSVCKLCCQTIYDQSSLVSGCEVVVSHVCEDTGIVYLQMQERRPLMDLLQKTIDEHSNVSRSITRPFMYQPCLRHYMSGPISYRALVVGDGVDTVKVSMVDLGREELVPTEQLKTIPVSLVGHSPAYAIPCILPKVNSIKFQTPEIHRWIEGKKLFATVLGYVNMLVHGVRKQVQKVTIRDCDSGHFLHQYLNSRAKEPSSWNGVIKEEPTSVDVEPVLIVKDTLKSCVIRSWGKSQDFTVNLVNSQGANVLENYLKDAYKIKVPESEVTVSQCYLLNSDAATERVKVIEDHKYDVTAERVDWGEALTVSKSRLFRCPEYLSLEKVPSQAINCSLIEDYLSDERPVHLVGQKVKIHFAEEMDGVWKVEILRVSNLLHESKDMSTSEYNKTASTLKDISCMSVSMKPEKILKELPKKRSLQKVQPVLEIYDEVIVVLKENYVTWVQRMVQTKELLHITALIKELQKEADLEPDIGVSKWSVGDVCIAQSPHTDSWYRVMIKSVNNDEIKVNFIDYGDEITLPRSRIIKSTPQITEFPPMAYKCKIINSDDFVIEENKTIYQISEMIDYDAGKETYEVCMHVPRARTWIPTINEDLFGFPSAQFVYDLEYEVQPAQIHDNGLITVHLFSQKEDFDELTNSIALGITGTNKLNKVKVGTTCLGQYTLDNLWYRAVITNVEGEKAIVRYMDYGNSETLPVDSLRELPKEWAKLPAQAIICGLDNEKESRVVLSHSLKDFKELHDFFVVGKFKKTSEGLLLMGAKVDGVSLIDILEEANVLEDSCNESTLMNSTASADSLPSNCYTPEKEFVARVSHVEDEETIYFQKPDQDTSTLLDSCADAIDKGLSVVVETPVRDSHYLGWDQMWYRCRLVEILESNRYKVLYVDYGMEGIVDQLYTLTPELLAMPPLASKCKLFPAIKSERHSAESYLCGQEIVGYLQREYSNYVMSHWKVVENETHSVNNLISIDSWFDERQRKETTKEGPICKVLVEGIKSAVHSSPSEDRMRTSNVPHLSVPADKGWDSTDTSLQPSSNLCSLNNSKTSMSSLLHFSDNVRALESTAISGQRTSTFNLKSPQLESSSCQSHSGTLLGTSLMDTVNQTPRDVQSVSDWGTRSTGYREVTDILKELSMSAQKAISRLVEPVSGERMGEKDRHELLDRLQMLVSLSTPNNKNPSSTANDGFSRDGSIL